MKNENKSLLTLRAEVECIETQIKEAEAHKEFQIKLLNKHIEKLNNELWEAQDELRTREERQAQNYAA